MATVAGLDVGLTYRYATSGICRTGQDGFVVAHTFADRTSRLRALGLDYPYSMIAIDGPLQPGLRITDRPRLCEKAFVLGAFQARCKPGESQVDGTGRALKRAATDTAIQLAPNVLGVAAAREFPHVAPGRNIVEAFPNAFLGVLVADEVYGSLRSTRGEKSDLLLEECRRNGALDKLQRRLEWRDNGFWDALQHNTHHDERAALVCALTSVCVWRGIYAAVGDNQEGGFFFLPPWELWQDWAKGKRSAEDGPRGGDRVSDAVARNEEEPWRSEGSGLGSEGDARGW